MLATITEQWWVLGADRQPVGPVTTEHLLERISSGEVATDCLVCVVGGKEWQVLAEIARFGEAVAEVTARPASEPPKPKKKRGLIEMEERTIVDGIPLWPNDPNAEITATAPRQSLVQFEEGEEHTVVDVLLRPSDPPE